MLNENYILTRIQPLLNSRREISEFEFFELFSQLEKTEQYEVINIMIKHDIDLVEEKDSEATILSDVAILQQDSVEGDFSKLMALTNEQLCVMSQEGNKTALAALLKKNERFIYQLAIQLHKQHNNTCLTVEDLFQEGCIGLIKATQKFDLSMDYKFLTYAWHEIRQKISRAAIDTGYTIRIPVHMFDKITKAYQLRRDNPEIVMDELLAVFRDEADENISELELKRIVMLGDYYMNTTSLNVLVGDNAETELMDFIPDDCALSTEEEVLEILLHEEISKVLCSLTPKEARIIQLRFGLDGEKPRTLEEIGLIYRVTRERIRQIEAKAIRKLRHPTRAKKLKPFYSEK